MTNIQDKSLIDEFIAESKEHLSSIEEAFIILEKTKDNPDKELINKIFRAVHTVKGSGGFFGFKNINDLAHSMETLLSLLREGEVSLSREHIDVLLEGVDNLNTMLDDVNHCNEFPIEAILEKLKTLLSRQVSKETLKEINAGIPLKDTKGNTLDFTLSEFTCRKILEHNQYLYLLKYDLKKVEKEKGLNPVKLVKNLTELGEIIDGKVTLPEASNIRKKLPEGELTYHVLYSTVLEPSLIKEAAHLNEENIIPVSRENLPQNAPSKTEKPPSPGEGSEKNTLPAQEKGGAQDPLAPKEEGNGADKHESVRIRVDILDKLMMLAGELVLVRNQQLMHAKTDEGASKSITQRLDIVTSELQETIMQTRMQPVGNIFGKFSRIVRDIGLKLGKKIEIEMSGNDVEVDKTILEALTDPLTHLIRNSCDHGIEVPEVRKAIGKNETGHIQLKAYHEGGQMVIEIRDDGKGIDTQVIRSKVIEKKLKTEEELSRMGEKELLFLIFLPGFSTVTNVTEFSGRGVGMDVVKNGIEKLGGTIEINSRIKMGTEIILRLPLTLAIIPSLIVKTGDYRYAIPQINLEELVCLYDEDVFDKIECAGTREVYRLRNTLLPMLRFDEVLKRPNMFNDEVKAEITEIYREKREFLKKQFLEARKQKTSIELSITFAVLKVGAARFGLIIDKVIGTEEIVVKPMHSAVKDLTIYSGATVLGDGNVALILDALGIARHAGIEFEKEEGAVEGQIKEKSGAEEKEALLLFKNGDHEQFAASLSSIKRIEKVSSDQLERVGNIEFITIDQMSTRILHLEEFLPVSPGSGSKEFFLILPKNVQTHCGIRISKLIDVGSFLLNLNREGFDEKGLKGSSLIKNQLTLVLDMEKILEKAEERWHAR